MSAVQNIHVSNEDLRLGLEKAFGTDAHILESNRKGYLTGEQAARLKTRLMEPMFGALVAVLVFLVLWFCYTSFAAKIPFEKAAGELVLRLFQPQKVFSPELFDSIRKPEGRIHSGAVIAMYLMILVALSRFPFRLLVDIMQREVYSYNGKIVSFEEEGIRKGEPDGITRYYYRLPNDWILEVKREEFEALDPGGVYRLFYLPRTRVVVAVEPLMGRGLLPEPASARPLTRVS